MNDDLIAVLKALMPAGNGRWVCVDVDGTLARYAGWKDSDTIGDPLPGAREFMQALRDRNYYVVVFTARRDLGMVRSWLDHHAIPCRLVTREKVPAIAYVDDRGIRFAGTWVSVARQIGRHAWWQAADADDGEAEDWQALTDRLDLEA